MNKEDISPRGYWLKVPKVVHFDKCLALALSEFFQNKTVVDLGCGTGDYVKLFRDRKIVCEGYDGNPCTPQLSDGLCQVADLSIPIHFSKFDWVLSLEVGEHIPTEYEDIFIDNIHRHNNEGVVVSWAIEGQDGFGHVNCRNNSYIIGKFEKIGYKYDELQSNIFRKISTLFWFKNTIMAFKRTR